MISAVSREPLLLLDIHHSGYLGWGIWCGPEMPEAWTAETVERLERHPHYRMGLNLGAQSYEWSPRLARRIRDWLARYQGRLSITGGDYAQPTACVRTGEANLRQILYGLEIIREALGVEVAIWTVSEPGNFAQLPQILGDLGYRGALLRIHGPGQRGSLTPRADEGVLWWQGPDGSRIAAVPEYEGDRLTPTAAVPHSMWMMTRYRNARQVPGDYTLDDLWRWKEAQAAKSIQPVVMSKDDDQNNQPGNNNLCMTSGHYLAADTAGDPRFRWVTAEGLFAELPEPQRVLVADPNLFETRHDAFNDYGYYGNADWQADLQAEAALRLADFATVLAAPVDNEDHEPALRRAWSAHLMAQNHDLALKRSLDVSLHLQYDARQTAEAVRDAALEALMARMDTGAEPGAVTVFNPLGWERSDYTRVALPEALAEAAQLYLEGNPIPWEVVRREAGWVVMGFLARVPALGYQVYTMGPGVEPPETEPLARMEGEGLIVETEAYTARFSPAEGGLAGLWAPSGEQVALERSLILVGEIGGRAVRSSGEVTTVHNGPVSAVVCEEGMVGPHHRYELTYRFVRGLPTIQLQVYLAAHYRDGDPGAPGVIGAGARLGLSLHLPETLGNLTCTRLQPFLVWPYDLAMDPVFAAPYWVDLSDESAGVAWLNEGSIGYRYDARECRVDNILAYGGISELRWNLGLLPHDRGWRSAQVHNVGLGFGHPLHACYVQGHGGDLGRRGQLCAIEPDTVTVSSVFRAGGRSYLRLYEHAGRQAEIVITRDGAPLPVQTVDLRLRPLGASGALALGPHRIGTFALP